MSIDPKFDNAWTDKLHSYAFQLGITAFGWRGRQYALDGRVRSVEIADKFTFSAAVQGTLLYECKLFLRSQNGDIHGECSCPFAKDCKHCLAAAYIILSLMWKNGSIFSKTISSMITGTLRGEEFLSAIKTGPVLQGKFFTEEQMVTASTGEKKEEMAAPPAASNKSNMPSTVKSHAQRHWWINFIASYKTQESIKLLSKAVKRYLPGSTWIIHNVLSRLSAQSNPITFLRELEDGLEGISNAYQLGGIRWRDPALKAFLDSPDAAELHETWRKTALEMEINRWLATSPAPHTSKKQTAAVKLVWIIRKSAGVNMLYYQLHFGRDGKIIKPKTASGIRQLYNNLAGKVYDMSSMDEGIISWLAFRHEINYNAAEMDNATFPLRDGGLWATLWGNSNKIYWEDGSPVCFNPVPAKLGLSDREGQCHWAAFGDNDTEGYPLSNLVADHRQSREPGNLFILQSGILRRLDCLGMPVATVCRLALSGGFSLQSLAPATGASLVRRLAQSGAPIAGLTVIQNVRVKPTVELRLDDSSTLFLLARAEGQNAHFILRQPGEWIPAEEFNSTAPKSFMLEDLAGQENSAPDTTEPPDMGGNGSGADNIKALCLAPAKEDLAELEAWLEKFVPYNAQTADILGSPGRAWKIKKGGVIALIQLWNARPRRANYLGTKNFRELVAIRPAPRLAISAETSGINWLELNVEMEEALKGISRADLLEAMTKEPEELVPLTAGIYRREDLEEYLKKLDMLAKAGIAPASGRQRLHAAQLAGNSESELLDIADRSEDLLDLSKKIRETLKNFKGIPSVAIGENTACQLRPYQKEGVDFLSWAGETFGGATLADEMGLGKTLQMLLMIAAVKKRQENAGLPSLVICPASVQQNWRREAECFAPWLKVGLLESGKGRHAILDKMGEYDILVKNYALTRRDQDKLRGQKWLVICVDEAQAIKNPSADITKAVKSLDAKYRFALTGTPLENRLTDLWSIIDFAVPGYLPPLSKFEAQSKESDGDIIRFLRARLRPVLLRRLKSEVARELPPRIEERLDCPMTPAQKKAYLVEAAKARQMVQNFKGKKEAGREKIMILAALTRLRQICCDPAVLGIEKAGSGKADELIRLVTPLMESGKKVLVFSQFVRVLGRLEERLAQEGIKTRILTGQSKQRQEIVDDFENDDSPSVFLISLKAGGTGLNLVSASYVVLFDPWWNPAIEAQAIDRTHRIGQDKTVVAFRLVAASTIEERILELQERKRQMIKNVLEEESFNRTLTKEDFEFLLNDQQPDPGLTE